MRSRSESTDSARAAPALPAGDSRRLSATAVCPARGSGARARRGLRDACAVAPARGGRAREGARARAQSGAGGTGGTEPSRRLRGAEGVPRRRTALSASARTRGATDGRDCPGRRWPRHRQGRGRRRGAPSRRVSSLPPPSFPIGDGLGPCSTAMPGKRNGASLLSCALQHLDQVKDPLPLHQ